MNWKMLYPWMHLREIMLILEELAPGRKTMLEWGSGGSTPFFAQYAKHMVSVEHDPAWFAKVQAPEKVRRFLVEPNLVVPPAESTYAAYKDYVDKPLSLGLKYDVVLIDGRARLACALKVIPHLAPGGVVFIHDFWKKTRGRYRPVLNHYKEIASVRSTTATIIKLRPK